MVKKAKKKYKKPALYKVTECDGTKISIKKVLSVEKSTSPLKDATLKENRGDLCKASHSETNKETKENLCEATCSDETNKNKISKKKKGRNKKTTDDKMSEETKENFCEATCSDIKNKNKISSKEMHHNKEINCDEVSEKKTADPIISIYEINNCKEEVVLKELSSLKLSKLMQNIKKLPKLKKPTCTIINDENQIPSESVTVYEYMHTKGVKTITCDKENKNKNSIKEESSRETSTCDKANKSENSVKKESSQKTSSDEKSNQEDIKAKGKNEKTPLYKASECDGDATLKENRGSLCEASHSETNKETKENLCEATCSDETNKDENSVKEESSQKTTSDKKSTEENIKVNSLFTLKNNILIGGALGEFHHGMNQIGFNILNALKEKPQFIGQVDVRTGEQITFQQMRENSVKLALMLKPLFDKPIINSNNIPIICTPIITICTRNPMVEYIPFLAALYLGAIVNPWEEKYFSVDLRLYYFLVKHKPNVIFVDDHNATTLQEMVKFLKRYGLEINPFIIVFNEKIGFLSLKEILAQKVDKKTFEEFSCNKINLSAPAILMFSPNAAHYPGDVIIPYMAFVSPANVEMLKMNYGEVGLWYGSLCWTHSLFLTARAIVSFTTAIKCPKSLFDETHLYKTIEKYKVTWIFLESSMCYKMYLTKFMVEVCDVSSLKTFLIGDTPIEKKIHEDFLKYLTGVSIMQVYSDALTGVIAYQRKSNLRSSGHVSRNVKVKIVDINTKKTIGPNKRGEIWCQTVITHRSRSIRFCNNKLYLVDDRITDDWYCTGDYGFFDENGEIYIVDKVRYLIKYKDTIVSAAEIEEVLTRHRAVIEAVVLPIQVANDGQHPVAFVRKALRAKVTEIELINHVAQNMDDNCKLRGGVYFVDKFERLPNGKIDRQRLKSDSKVRYCCDFGDKVVEL